MFFYLSKIFWWLFDPGNLVFILLLTGVIFLLFKRQKTGTFFCTIALLFFFVTGGLPVGSYMLHKLENRFAQVEQLPDDIDGIIILGGMLNVLLSDQRNTPSLNSNVERITALLDLRESYPNVPVVFTGGAGLLGYPDLNESVIIKPVLQKMKGQGNTLLFENRSRNTYENAAYTKELLGEKAKGTWLLVTSARHIPRAVASYRAQGMNVLPYPVDYRVGKEFKFGLTWNVRAGQSSFQTGLHEWLGLFAYYLTDKTTELFPAPK